MPKIKFTKAYRVKGATPEDSPSYKEGQTVEVSEASARHFVNRGVAEMVTARQAAPVEPKEEEKEPEGYETNTVEELHKIAHDRNIEGRSALTTKADLIDAIEKDDKSRASAKSQQQQQKQQQKPQQPK